MAKQITITYTNSLTISVSDHFIDDDMFEFGNAVSSSLPSIEDVCEHLSDMGYEVEEVTPRIVDADFIEHTETIVQYADPVKEI